MTKGQIIKLAQENGYVASYNGKLKKWVFTNPSNKKSKSRVVKKGEILTQRKLKIIFDAIFDNVRDYLTD